MTDALADRSSDLGCQDFEAARERIRGLAVRTPLLRLDADGEIYIKLESLQPIGSFKIRGAANALVRRGAAVARGANTASAGNFAQGLAYVGRALSIAIRAYVPESAAEPKVEALRRLGAEVVMLPFEKWWEMLSEPQDDPAFIHPFMDPDVLAGNGTIALEILDELRDAATVFAPYGGGGLSVGIAMALRAAGSAARVVAAESEAGAPLSAAFAAGRPVRIDFDAKSFVSGIGSPFVLDAMWPLVKAHLAGSVVSSFEQTAAAIRLLAERHHVIAEGAGAVSVAAALAERPPGPTVSVVSGGHLDMRQLVTILEGGLPQ